MLSIIKPINNQNYQKSQKMNKNIKLNVPWDFWNVLYPCGSVRHLEENTDCTIVFKIYLTINLFDQKINWRQN